MNEQVVATPEVLPFAEFVMRPADSRPVVIQLLSTSDEPFVSEGDTSDLEQAQMTLEVMQNVARAYWNLRYAIAQVGNIIEHKSFEGDDSPPW